MKDIAKKTAIFLSLCLMLFFNLRKGLFACWKEHSETDWDEWGKNEVAIVETAIHKNIIQTAERMKSRGHDITEISKITGLTQDEIERLWWANTFSKYLNYLQKSWHKENWISINIKEHHGNTFPFI